MLATGRSGLGNASGGSVSALAGCAAADAIAAQRQIATARFRRFAVMKPPETETEMERRLLSAIRHRDRVLGISTRKMAKYEPQRKQPDADGLPYSHRS